MWLCRVWGLQEKLDAREESEEKYRDYACMHFESMAPAPAKVYKWVWDPDNGKQADAAVDQVGG